MKVSHPLFYVEDLCLGHNAKVFICIININRASGYIVNNPILAP